MKDWYQYRPWNLTHRAQLRESTHMTYHTTALLPKSCGPMADCPLWDPKGRSYSHPKYWTHQWRIDINIVCFVTSGPRRHMKIVLRALKVDWLLLLPMMTMIMIIASIHYSYQSSIILCKHPAVEWSVRKSNWSTGISSCSIQYDTTVIVPCDQLACQYNQYFIVVGNWIYQSFAPIALWIVLMLTSF